MNSRAVSHNFQTGKFSFTGCIASAGNRNAPALCFLQALNCLRLKTFSELCLIHSIRLNPEIDTKDQKALLIKSELSIWLDTYDDIFSDFDPRPLNERALSDDFLSEARKMARDTP